ncbi:MAG: prolyl oligopeptidase family serine peptidase, partial [Candidatus Eremiobacterota bacterium]
RTGDHLVALLEVDATSRLHRYDLEGRFLGEVPLPALGSVTGVGREWDGHEVYFGFASFTFPPEIYRHDLRSNTTELWGKVEADVRPDRYEVRQEWCRSPDGTRIPVFVVHRRGLSRNGGNPTLLTGYGGFNVSMTPDFYRTNFLWLEHGGVFAMANLRGGSEYGETWHKAGMLGNKQNVFDDFVAAAEHLIREGYTSADRLAISGGSNGGLLVGAALTQRPELFRAVICSVPLLDMLRYHRFRLARLWIPEYGSSEDEEAFGWLAAYSPYHQVREHGNYPAVLLMSGVEDSRVDPMHARKMAARLQAATASDRPVLLRMETRAGHGAGKPLSKILEESTDRFSFLFWQLGVGG